tara:strand:- start:594 stop:1076 length:483 start_codon:yes stop_codon:yes gene_type:complete
MILIRKIKTALSLLCLLLLTYSCNYKPLLLTDLGNYNIIEINTSGEKRIGHILKNKIKINPDNEGTPLSLDLGIKKNKSISEKNIKNKATKYKIDLVIDITVTNLNNNNKKFFSVIKSGIYNSSSQYSSNLKSEKNLINTLINDLSDEILRKTMIQLNDI